MALDAIRDSIDDLPDPIREHYAAGTGDLAGKFVLSVTKVGGMELSDTASLLQGIARERTAAKDLREKLSGFGDITSKQAREALEKAKGAKDWGDREKQLIQIHQDEKGRLQKKVDTITGQLKESLVRSRAQSAIQEANGNVNLLLPFVEQRVKITETTSGRHVAEVLDDEGRARIDAKGDPVSISSLVEEMKTQEVYAPLFSGAGARGAGSQGSEGAGGAGGRVVISREDSRDFQKLTAAEERANKMGVPLEVGD
jgi:hypothetical protein